MNQLTSVFTVRDDVGVCQVYLLGTDTKVGLLSYSKSTN